MTAMVAAQRASEAPDVGDAILRLMRGLVARAAEGDLEAVEQLRRVERETPNQLGQAVAAARVEADYSWADLAPYLGTTRTSASERFKDVEAPPLWWSTCRRAFTSRTGKAQHETRCRACRSAS